MDRVTVCLCGCGEPAEYAARHVKSTLRAADRLSKWEERDTGYSTPCHIWVGQLDYGDRPGRYGILHHAGRYQKAHRVIWQIEKGPIPPGFQVHHLCGVTQCVNTAHLLPLSASEHIRLERAKLNPDLVRYIKTTDSSGVELARELNVSISLISQVRTREIWADIE